MRAELHLIKLNFEKWLNLKGKRNENFYVWYWEYGGKYIK